MFGSTRGDDVLDGSVRLVHRTAGSLPLAVRPRLAHHEPVLATTPDPPYVTVIFTAVLGPDTSGYDTTVAEMRVLAQEQEGYLGMDSAGGDAGRIEITVSYWRTAADASGWKAVAEHVEAQRLGKERWYESYQVRIAHVDRAYGRSTSGPAAGSMAE